MSDFHKLNSTPSQKQIEKVGVPFLGERLLDAQLKTIQVCQEIKSKIEVGMTEVQACKMALDCFKNHGVTKHWHRPTIRLGRGTTLSFFDPIQTEYRLEENTPFYIDLGPVWPGETPSDLGVEYEGDYGDTYVLGQFPEAQHCAEVARSLFYETKNLWRNSWLNSPDVEKFSGKALYQHLKKRANELGYLLIEGVAGHRIGDFPHQRHSKEQLANIDFIPNPHLWVLEIHIVEPQRRFGAFFEDILA